MATLPVGRGRLLGQLYAREIPNRLSQFSAAAAGCLGLGRVRRGGRHQRTAGFHQPAFSSR